MSTVGSAVNQAIHGKKNKSTEIKEAYEEIDRIRMLETDLQKLQAEVNNLRKELARKVSIYDLDKTLNGKFAKRTTYQNKLITDVNSMLKLFVESALITQEQRNEAIKKGRENGNS